MQALDLLPPLNPVTPSVTLTGPRTASVCPGAADVVLTANAAGLGGRAGVFAWCDLCYLLLP
jgi:hypothetical protein